MRAAEPLPPADAAIEAIREGLIRYFVEEDGADRQRVRELRRRIADRIEADLALLDALDPDPEAEPSLGASEPFTVGPALDWVYGSGDDREEDAGDDREHENEHGGDIQDEPHDSEEDLGAEEDEGSTANIVFDGLNTRRVHPRSCKREVFA
ncbi:hypothetical protein [Methylobacterium sp. SI9]|uniref:hypothetical protein n=1 Tax=Methylobacterium guangdongense TaxID=3138811 RepID=UPI00313AE7A9